MFSDYSLIFAKFAHSLSALKFPVLLLFPPLLEMDSTFEYIMNRLFKWKCRFA